MERYVTVQIRIPIEVLEKWEAEAARLYGTQRGKNKFIIAALKEKLEKSEAIVIDETQQILNNLDIQFTTEGGPTTP